MEQELRRWIQQTPGERETLLQLFPDLELDYKNVREANHALAYFAEAFLNGPELVQLALSILNFDFEGEQKAVVANLKAIVEKYANLDLEIDKGGLYSYAEGVSFQSGFYLSTGILWYDCHPVWRQ